jgi:hypothetical protein
MRLAWVVLAAGVVAAPRTARGQEFTPPRVARASSGTHLGLFGFGVRGGVDLQGNGQLVVGTTLDLGDLFSSRLRLRPSGELGVFNGPNSYVGSFEALYRFTPDDQAAIPYLGTGLSLAGHDHCGTDPGCPAVWVNLVVGFELHYGSTFNWLLEYHGMDALRRHRVFIGLTTRRGN